MFKYLKHSGTYFRTKYLQYVNTNVDAIYSLTFSKCATMIVTVLKPKWSQNEIILAGYIISSECIACNKFKG